MDRLNSETLFRRGSEHVETRAGDQTMMMSVARGKYYALASTAQHIWDLLAEPASVGSIVDRLLEEYDVARDVCEAEVRHFLVELLEQGLIEEVGDGRV